MTAPKRMTALIAITFVVIFSQTKSVMAEVERNAYVGPQGSYSLHWEFGFWAVGPSDTVDGLDLALNGTNSAVFFSSGHDFRSAGACVLAAASRFANDRSTQSFVVTNAGSDQESDQSKASAEIAFSYSYTDASDTSEGRGVVRCFELGNGRYLLVEHLGQPFYFDRDVSYVEELLEGLTIPALDYCDPSLLTDVYGGTPFPVTGPVPVNGSETATPLIGAGVDRCIIRY